MLIATQNRRRKWLCCQSVCRSAFNASVFLCSYLKVKHAAFNSLSTRVAASFFFFFVWWLKEKNIKMGLKKIRKDGRTEERMEMYVVGCAEDGERLLAQL